MEKMFRNRLVKNEKIGASPMVNEALLLQQANSSQQSQSKKSLLAVLTDSARSVDETVASNLNNLRPSSVSAEALTRPARSTRSTAPVHDQGVPEKQKNIVKASEDPGFGTRWRR